jgi:hypothetical protein
MRFRFSGLVMSACLCGALLDGCAGGGSSATRAAGALPAGGQSAAVQPPAGAVRRTQSVPTCSGTSGFVAEGGGSNVSDAAWAGILYGYGNEVCDSLSSIVGGYTNVISSGGDTAQNSFIGGGNTNTITGGAEYGFIGGGSTNKVSAQYGVIAGGTNNNVSGEGGYIAAGGYNTVSGEGAVADGGFENTAGGNFATIPGGYGNSAAGIYSFAAGVHASAVQNGTFVWSDGSNGNANLASTAAYQFLARAAGGFTLWSNAAATVGATLAPGSGTWASASDRNLKTDVAQLDDAAVLAKVAELPISRWSYKSERGIRHVGPMAQDFYAAFGVGEDDKHITTIDEDGVALAAIKALHTRVRSLDMENVRLRRELAAERAHDRRVDAELAHLVAVLPK